MERPLDARNGIVGATTSSSYGDTGATAPSGARMNVGAAASGANVNVSRSDLFKAWFIQKRRALVVVTLPDHEAWLTSILTNWQFSDY